MDGIRTLDLLQLLQDRFVILSGGRDRRGGPLLSFPSTPRRERVKPEDMRRVLAYLLNIPSDSAKGVGFTVLLDMRGNGNNMTCVKTILKILQENFCAQVQHVVIIKPDNFWQKQRASISSHKYKFETSTISIETLAKIADCNQLTADFEGTLAYEHSNWIDVRMALEDFLWQVGDMLDRFDDLQEDLARSDFADDVNGAKSGIDHHADMKKKVLKLPIEELDQQGKKLLGKFSVASGGQSGAGNPVATIDGAAGRGGSVGADDPSGSSGSTAGGHRQAAHSQQMPANPDMAGMFQQVLQQLDAVHKGQQHLLTVWQHKKNKLDQCFQLRLFEQDCEKMFDWILHNRDVFQMSYVEIGHNYSLAKSLQDEHQKFAVASMNVCVNINRILAVAVRLKEGNHYAAQHIRTVAGRLDRTWKEFAAGLDERTAVLGLSVLFHHKAEQYCDSVSSWAAACEATQPPPSDIQGLETAIRTHQSLYEAMCQAYTEVYNAYQTLLKGLASMLQVFHGIAMYSADDENGSGGGADVAATSDAAATAAGHVGPSMIQPMAAGDVMVSDSSGVVAESLAATVCVADGCAEASADCSDPSVHSTSKKLLYQLDHLVQVCNQPPPPGVPDHRKHENGGRYERANPAADYSEGASHVLAVIHQILKHHRSLEDRWHAEKVRLHQTLALRLFQEDVKQVLDWLENHGEVFLRKNTGIGRNLQKARVYQKSHEHFENVAQNTYSNARKLLAAADDLARTGEVDAAEIYAVARELELHVNSFEVRVAQRKRRLDMAVLFYTHEREVSSWVDQLRQEIAADEALLAQEGLDGTERLLQQCQDQQKSTLNSCVQTLAQGEVLLQEIRSLNDDNMDATGSMGALQTALEQLAMQKLELDELWTARKFRLDLYLRLRLFERDALEVSSQLEMWAEELQHTELSHDYKTAEQFLQLHNESVTQMQTTTYKVLQQGQDLVQLFESAGFGAMADGTHMAQTRIQYLLEFLHDRELDLEDLAELKRVKLEQAVQLCQFRVDAQQVISWIRNGEAMLIASFATPNSLPEAEQLRKEHEQFQVAVEKTHTSAVRVKCRADALINASHYDPQSIRDIADDVTKKWQLLVTCAEERHKLVTASMNFYKTAETVCNVLDSLEREYRRDDDWCGGVGTPDKPQTIGQLISRHQGQKEQFLKACTLARRTAETFLKYTARSLQYYEYQAHGSCEQRVKAILDRLLSQENHVLEYWTHMKKRLDQCHQFVLFERSAKQTIEWIHSTGEVYLAARPSAAGKSRDEAEALLREHNEFKGTAKETRDRVKVLIQLADNLVEKGHRHAASIKQWVATVDQRYKEFSTRMDTYREELERALGMPRIAEESGAASSCNTASSSLSSMAGIGAPGSAASTSSMGATTTSSSLSSSVGIGSAGGVPGDRHSDPSLEAKLVNATATAAGKELNEEKRKSARRKEFIMAEMIQTERTYVKDLETCIKAFVHEMRTGANVPAGLVGKEDVLFANIEAIHAFHEKIFLRELEKYETMPEDVGHCFVTWAAKFDMYVLYCKNKELSNTLMVQQSGNYFDELQRKHRLEHPLPAYLIKPVQRITKYVLLLKDLQSCCDEGQGEIRDGLEVMLNVPTKANNALHLSQLEQCDVSVESLGEVVLQDSFLGWDNKQIIRKGRERRVFLFELYLVFAKEVKDSSGGGDKYQFKHKLMTSELGVTEHIEGDECKFSVWTGRAPMVSDYRIVLKANTLETKLLWVKKLREVIQETYFSGASLTLPKSPAKQSKAGGAGASVSQRASKDLDDTLAENDHDGSSLASFGSGNTTDSDKAGVIEMTWVVADYTATPGTNEVSVAKGQQVEVLDTSGTSGTASTAAAEFCLVRLSLAGGGDGGGTQEGLVPVAVLKPAPSSKPAGGRRAAMEAAAAAAATAHADKDANAENCDLTGEHAVAASPINKRRAFTPFSRKWLTPQRKQSAGKVDKNAPTPAAVPLVKKSADKSFKLPTQNENALKTSMHSSQLAHGPQDLEAEEENQVELPPPMKPIQDPPTSTMNMTNGPTGSGGTGAGSATGSAASGQQSALATSSLAAMAAEQDICKRTSSISLKTMEGNAASDLADIELFVKEKTKLHESKKNFLAENNIAADNNRLLSLTEEGSVASTSNSTHLQHPSTSDLQQSSSSGLNNGGSGGGGGNNGTTSSAGGGGGGDDDDNTLEYDVERVLKKRTYVLRELISTEEAYVSDLAVIVDGFMREIRDEDSEIVKPEDLRGEDGRKRFRMIFGNVEAINEWHRDFFLKQLQNCLTNTSLLGPLFKRCERKLHMYVVYCQNKPVSEHIVAEHFGYFEEIRFKLKQKLDINALLIKPVQRIMKYELLMQDIFKYTERAGLVEEIPDMRDALYVMKVVPHAANDMMYVGRLQKFGGNITAQGKLLLHGPLMCTEYTQPGNADGRTGNSNSGGGSGSMSQKPRVLQVFLFEQNIIFSEIVGKKTQFNNPSYIYRSHVQVNKMKMTPMGENRIELRSSDPNRSDIRFVLQTQNGEQYAEWVSNIDTMLQTQHDFLKAIQSPIKHQEKLKESTTPNNLRKTFSSPANVRHGGATTAPILSDRAQHPPQFPPSSAQKQHSLPPVGAVGAKVDLTHQHPFAGGPEPSPTLRPKPVVPPLPPVRNTSINATGHAVTTAAELSQMLHDIAEQQDEEWQLGATAMAPISGGGGRPHSRAATPASTAATGGSSTRFSFDSTVSLVSSSSAASMSSTSTLQSFGSSQRLSSINGNNSTGIDNDTDNAGLLSQSVSSVSMDSMLTHSELDGGAVAAAAAVDNQLLLQQRRWTAAGGQQQQQQQQQPRTVLTMNIHEQHRLSDSTKDAAYDSMSSPTATISSPSCSSLASSAASGSDKRSLWSFGSKFSPRRSADMSDKFVMKPAPQAPTVPSSASPMSNSLSSAQSAATADYVNLPFDFSAAQSTVNNGNAIAGHQQQSQYHQPAKSNQPLLQQQQQQPPPPPHNLHQPHHPPPHHHHHQAPEIVSRSQDCVIPFGATAILSCRIRNHEHASISWRKTEPNPAAIVQSAKFNYIVTAAGEARLMIAQAAKADGGLYVCAVSNRYGITQCTIGVSVLSSQLDVLSERDVEAVGPTALRVSWESLNQYVIEVYQIPAPSTPTPLAPAIASASATAGKWLRPDGGCTAVRSKHIVHGLAAGETYQVRLVCPSTGAQSAPSPAITMPISEQHMWQQQQFANRYAPVAERAELGRGRFAVCRVASDLVTRQAVALKQVWRRHQELEATQEEYRLLAAAQHPNIVRALALFENAPTPGADTIVMELVDGPHLFSYVCQAEHYSELIVHSYMRQLVSALQWLHARHTAHLDVKPENLMVHLPTANSNTPQPTSTFPLPPGTLKLIDFGESAAVRCVRQQRDNAVLPPANLEFAAPEMVMGQPLGEATDSWGFGILLYVFLSGVSPFLDDSAEETTANILKCDFSFPEDYFAAVSADAMALLGRLLVLPVGARATMAECQQSAWFVQEPQRTPIAKAQLEAFNERRMRSSSVTAMQSLRTDGGGGLKLT